jgi:hypothetical protein
MDADNGEFLSTFKPQELSNTAWAIATLYSKRDEDEDMDEELHDVENDVASRVLRKIAQALKERVDEFKSQEVSNTIWAFATAGFGYHESALGYFYTETVHLSKTMSEEDHLMLSQTLDVVAANVVQRLEKFRPQELNNMAWGIARLGHSSEIIATLFQGIAQQAIMRVRQFSSQVSFQN